MAYAVYTTESFDKEVEKLEKDEQVRVEKLFLQLKENPYVGDQLRYRFFREKRIDEKRIYYFVYDDLNLVLLVGISGKKDQQKTLNYLVRYFNEFREYAEKLSYT
jgi:mRNA-degrading endonuclease RelE of RelBE toxin-antitoxin system